MNGLLLSGWRVWVPDEVGNPLYHGRVCFFDADTDEPSNVYSDKELANPIGTVLGVDVNGFLPPNVWLDRSHLYKCQVQRKLQDDPETWETLWTIDDVGEVEDNSGLATATTAFVNSVSELRQLDPGAFDYVYVLGWFTPGDAGTPLVFKWQSNETTNKDDGHWITPSSSPVSGRWEQFFGSYVDVRKFGAIPDTGEYVDDAIVRAMNYAKEPNTKDLSDDTIYKPKQVVFAKSGNYKIGSNLNFNLYRMIPAFGSDYVPVNISQGVVFTSDRSVTLTIGYGCKVDADNAIVDENVTLDIVEGSFEYVRPQWWNGTDLLTILSLACGTNCDVKVYGDLTRFTGSNNYYLVDRNATFVGKGRIIFEKPSFYFNFNLSNSFVLRFSIEIVCGDWPLFDSINDTSDVNVRFQNHSQTIRSSWFKDNDGFVKGNQLFNSYYVIDGQTTRQAKGSYIFTGGKLSSDTIAVEGAVCDFLSPVEMNGHNIEGVTPKTPIQMAFKFGSGESSNYAFINSDEIYVEWFGSFSDAVLHGANPSYNLNSKRKTIKPYGFPYTNPTTLISNAIYANLTGFDFTVSNDAIINGSVDKCNFNGNHTIDFGVSNTTTFYIKDSTFSWSFLKLHADSSDKVISVTGNKFYFTNAGQVLIDFANGDIRPKILVTNNLFKTNESQVVYGVSLSENWTKRKLGFVNISNNPGCNVTTEFNNIPHSSPVTTIRHIYSAKYVVGSGVSYTYKGPIIEIVLPTEPYENYSLGYSLQKSLSSVSLKDESGMTTMVYTPYSTITSERYMFIPAGLSLFFNAVVRDGIRNVTPTLSDPSERYIMVDSGSSSQDPGSFVNHNLTKTNSFICALGGEYFTQTNGSVTFNVSFVPTFNRY